MENPALTGKSDSKKLKKTRTIIIGLLVVYIVSCLTFIIIINIINIRAVRTSGSIRIDDVTVTTGYDPKGTPNPSVDTFSADVSRIYCIVSISSPKPVQIGVRWYLEDTLIFKSEEMVDKWRAFYIQPKPGTTFQEGEYRVEIFLIQNPMRTIYFSVTE